MQQIGDLYNDPEFQALDIGLVSIAKDSLEEQAAILEEFNVPTAVPILSDPDGTVSSAYSVDRYAMPNGEPSHTFVLVNQDGKIVWFKDYGFPDNPQRTMYVEPLEIVDQVKSHLP
jgi:peroxiredoxin